MRNEPCGRDIVIPYILYFILNFRMKRFRFCLVAGMLLFISVSTVAKGVPTSIQAAFEKMYPYVANAQWEQMAQNSLLTAGKQMCGSMKMPNG